MKTAFVFLAILATAMASSTRRWGSSQPEPADDPECKKILGKLSGLWSRENLLMKTLQRQNCPQKEISTKPSRRRQTK